MYGVMKKIEDLHTEKKEFLRKIYYEEEQHPGYPICARFNLQYYDLLILSPLTANSVAKINVGIADNLITNIFSQMLKGNGKIIIYPCDLVPGEIETEIPNGDKIMIHIDQFNSDNAKKLEKFPNVSLVRHPNEIMDYID